MVHGLKCNPCKTQVSHLSQSPSSTCSGLIHCGFCGQPLPFIDTVLHHLLQYNLSDAEDFNSKLHNMVRKANCLLATFTRVGPFILTHLHARNLGLLLNGASLSLWKGVLVKAFQEVLSHVELHKLSYWPTDWYVFHYK